jgi:hypothetical protein
VAGLRTVGLVFQDFDDPPRVHVVRPARVKGRKAESLGARSSRNIHVWLDVVFFELSVCSGIGISEQREVVITDRTPLWPVGW